MNIKDWEIVEDLSTDLVKYPVPIDWLPGVEDGIWRRYTPFGQRDSPRFAAVTRLETGETEAQAVLDDWIETYVRAGTTNLK